MTRSEIERHAHDLGWIVNKGGLRTRFERDDGWRINTTWSDNGIAASMSIANPDGVYVESMSWLRDKWAVGIALRERLESPAGAAPARPQSGDIGTSEIVAQLRGLVSWLRSIETTALISPTAIADRLAALADAAEGADGPDDDPTAEWDRARDRAIADGMGAM